MGYFIYATGTEYELDDRSLSHLKVAISLKLRHQECFLVSWEIPADAGSGRVSFWVGPQIPLAFKFSGSRPPEMNPVWIETMRELSHTSRGLVLIPEREAEAYARNKANALLTKQGASEEAQATVSNVVEE